MAVWSDHEHQVSGAGDDGGAQRSANVQSAQLRSNPSSTT